MSASAAYIIASSPAKSMICDINTDNVQSATQYFSHETDSNIDTLERMLSSQMWKE
jgi:hypothetical protein